MLRRPACLGIPLALFVATAAQAQEYKSGLKGPAAGAVGQYDATVQHARSKAADYLVREQIADACDGKAGRIDPKAVIERDLTGDGKADLIISHEGISCDGRGRSSACGMQVCSVKIYVREGALLKLAVDDLLGMEVKVGDGAVPAIEWRIRSGVPRMTKWNGRAFR